MGSQSGDSSVVVVAVVVVVAIVVVVDVAVVHGLGARVTLGGGGGHSKFLCSGV